MSKEIKPDYTTQFLLPPSLEDWIAEDHPARFIREFVDVLDLEAIGFRMRPEDDRGRSNYSADLLLKVWLYGYVERIYSTRKLERACMNQMPLIWLTGNNVPDHNTLWRFFKDNQKAMKKLFRHTAKLALDAGMVGMILHAVDGTKVRARGSEEKVLDRERIDELMARIEESVDRMVVEVDANEGSEEGSYRMPSALASSAKLREYLLKAKERMETEGVKYLHPGEDEARLMKCEGKVALSYNAQAVVDEKEMIIVAEEVVNEENDMHQLTFMIDAVTENLGACADETLADNGYYASEELAKSEEKGYSVLVSLKDKYEDEFHWTNFYHDEKNDCLICPMGARLEYAYTDRCKRLPAKVYRCLSHKDCPRRCECSSDRIGRRVKLGVYHKAMMRQKEKQRSREMKALLKKRKYLIEPIFAIIKQCMVFRRFTVFGLDNVRSQWALICTVYNLKKLYKFWQSGKPLLMPIRN